LSVLPGAASHDAKDARHAGKRRLQLAADDEQPQINAESAGSHAASKKRFERPLMIVRTAVCRLRPKAPQKASKSEPVY
jgi:hypothetical protein